MAKKIKHNDDTQTPDNEPTSSENSESYELRSLSETIDEDTDSPDANTEESDVETEHNPKQKKPTLMNAAMREVCQYIEKTYGYDQEEAFQLLTKMRTEEGAEESIQQLLEEVTPHEKGEHDTKEFLFNLMESQYIDSYIFEEILFKEKQDELIAFTKNVETETLQDIINEYGLEDDIIGVKKELSPTSKDQNQENVSSLTATETENEATEDLSSETDEATEDLSSETDEATEDLSSETDEATEDLNSEIDEEVEESNVQELEGSSAEIQFEPNVDDLLKQLDEVSVEIKASKKTAIQKAEEIRKLHFLQLRNRKLELENMRKYREEVLQNLKSELQHQIEDLENEIEDQDLESDDDYLQEMQEDIENKKSLLEDLKKINTQDNPSVLPSILSILKNAEDKNNVLLALAKVYSPYLTYPLPKQYESVYIQLNKAKKVIEQTQSQSSERRYSVAQLSSRNKSIQTARRNLSESKQNLKIRFNPGTRTEYVQHIKNYGIISAAKMFFLKSKYQKNKEVQAVLKNFDVYQKGVEEGLNAKESAILNEFLSRIKANKSSAVNIYMEQVSNLLPQSKENDKLKKVVTQVLPESEYKEIINNILEMLHQNSSLVSQIDFSELPCWPRDNEGKPILQMGNTQAEQALFYSKNLWEVFNTRDEAIPVEAYILMPNDGFYFQHDIDFKAIDCLDSKGKVIPLKQYEDSLFYAEQELASLSEMPENQKKAFTDAIEDGKDKLEEAKEELNLSNRLISEIRAGRIDLFGKEGPKCIKYFLENDPELCHAFLNEKLQEAMQVNSDIDRVNDDVVRTRSIKKIAAIYSLMIQLEDQAPELSDARALLNFDLFTNEGHLTADIKTWQNLNKTALMLQESVTLFPRTIKLKDYQNYIEFKEKLDAHFLQQANVNDFNDLIKYRVVINNLFGVEYFEKILMHKLTQIQEEKRYDDLSVLLFLAEHELGSANRMNKDFYYKLTEVFTGINQSINSELDSILLNKTIEDEAYEKLNYLFRLVGNPDIKINRDEIRDTLKNILSNATPQGFLKLWNIIPAEWKLNNFKAFHNVANQLDKLYAILTARSLYTHVANLTAEELINLKIIMNEPSIGMVSQVKQELNEQLLALLSSKLKEVINSINHYTLQELEQIRQEFSNFCFMNTDISAHFNAVIANELNKDDIDIDYLIKLKECIPLDQAILKKVDKKLSKLAALIIEQNLGEQTSVMLDRSTVTNSLMCFNEYLNMLSRPAKNLNERKLAEFTQEDVLKDFVQHLSVLKDLANNKSYPKSLTQALSIKINDSMKNILIEFSKNLEHLVNHDGPDNNKLIKLMFSQLIFLSEVANQFEGENFDDLNIKINKCLNDLYKVASTEAKFLNEMLANSPPEMWEKIYAILPDAKLTNADGENKNQLNKQQFMRLCEHVLIKQFHDYLNSPIKNNEKAESLNAKIAFVNANIISIKGAHELVNNNFKAIKHKIDKKKNTIQSELQSRSAAFEEELKQNQQTPMDVIFSATKKLENKIENDIKEQMKEIEITKTKIDSLEKSMQTIKDNLTEESQGRVKKQIDEINKMDPNYLQLKENATLVDQVLRGKKLLLGRLEQSIEKLQEQILNPAISITDKQDLELQLSLDKEMVESMHEEIYIKTLEYNSLLSRISEIGENHKTIENKYKLLIKNQHNVTKMQDNLHDWSIQAKQAHVQLYQLTNELNDMREIQAELQSVKTVDPEANPTFVDSLSHMDERVFTMVCEKENGIDDTMRDNLRQLKTLANQNEVLSGLSSNSPRKMAAAVDDELMKKFTPDVQEAIKTLQQPVDNSFAKVMCQIICEEAKESPLAPKPKGYTTSTDKLQSTLRPEMSVFEAKMSKITANNRHDLYHAMYDVVPSKKDELEKLQDKFIVVKEKVSNDAVFTAKAPPSTAYPNSPRHHHTVKELGQNPSKPTLILKK